MRSPQTKQDYQKETEARLKSIRTRINSLEKRAGKAEADIEVRYDQKMDQIRGQYAQAKEKLEALGRTSQDDWSVHKEELERSIDVLSEAVESVARHISV